MEIAKGLAGTFACETQISSIIDDHLSYVGYDISELMENDIQFEEVIFLLWNLRLPTAEELKEFQKSLAKSANISGNVEACLRIQCRENLHPMSVLRSTVSLLGVFDPEAELTSQEATYRQSLLLQAKMPTIVAAFSRLRRGQDPIKPRSDLGLAANFLYMLTGEEASCEHVSILNKALILHADHELNASTFAARVCASTLSDVYSCITTAIGTLKGPLHGGANERVFEMLEEITARNEDVIGYLREKLDSNEKIMGFGHRVYSDRDPREVYLKKMAYEITVNTPNEKWYRLSTEVEQFIREEKGLIPNVDFYSATVYHSLGINSDLFTLIFAISRVAGWLAHVNEQKCANALIRPRSKYIGKLGLKYKLEENA